MHRFYALQLAPTLFGEWVLVAEWGRIGSPGAVRQKVFHSADLAHEALKKCQTGLPDHESNDQSVSL
jgi:predicted DNA-binding WGR domain protein